MSQYSDRWAYLGMPGYGKQTSAAGRGFWRAREDMSRTHNHYQNGSLLAANFNQLWCGALNMAHEGRQVDYFAMLHDDIGPPDYWLDALIDELEANDLDMLGVVVPIKDTRGMTSLALHKEGDNWSPDSRLSMHDAFELPETFTSKDIGEPLLLNTGCWVCRFDMRWVTKVHFEINDRIVFNTAINRYQSQTEPEDWYFSRLCHEIGLKIGATRKVSISHQGDLEFTNKQAWGTHSFDKEARRTSPVPGAFPRDIPGWLMPEEGRKLAELATGKRVLEIGSYCGLSTVCMGRTAKHVTAVDYFDGRLTQKTRDTLAEFRNNIERHGIADKISICHPHESFALDEYDLAFVDAAHDYLSVRRDIEKARAVLAADGVIVFHDYQSVGNPGVTEAVDELLSDGGILLSQTESLAVVSPPALIPLEV